MVTMTTSSMKQPTRFLVEDIGWRPELASIWAGVIFWNDLIDGREHERDSKRRVIGESSQGRLGGRLGTGWSRMVYECGQDDAQGKQPPLECSQVVSGELVNEASAENRRDPSMGERRAMGCRERARGGQRGSQSGERRAMGCREQAEEVGSRENPGD